MPRSISDIGKRVLYLKMSLFVGRIAGFPDDVEEAQAVLD